MASSWIHSYTVEEPPVQSTTNRPIWQLDADSDAPAGELCRAPFDPDRLGNPERTPPTPATIAGELSWSVATASWSAEASDNADSAFDGTLGVRWAGAWNTETQKAVSVQSVLATALHDAAARLWGGWGGEPSSSVAVPRRLRFRPPPPGPHQEGITSTTIPFKYSVSGMVGKIGWSARWVCTSTCRTVRFASTDARHSISKNSGRPTWCEQV